VVTRINLVPPAELVDLHLLAEYRELPRVFSLVEKRAVRGTTPDRMQLPTEFCLGKGHVRFFYDKLLWLSWRQIALVNELMRRDYDPQFRENMRVTYQHIPSIWWNDWQPTETDVALSRQRIEERLKDMAANGVRWTIGRVAHDHPNRKRA
jgi:deoxyribonuclease (pyrimidine dimer)